MCLLVSAAKARHQYSRLLQLSLYPNAHDPLFHLAYMALITFSGYPSSGKTRRAIQLKDHLDRRLADPSYSGLGGQKVVVLSDDSLNIDRSSYNESRLEKPARAALFAAVQRQMGQDTILIVDSLNYIKGFRYQLYCAAREFKLRVCTK